MQPLWRTIKSCLVKLYFRIPQDLAIQSLVVYQREILVVDPPGDRYKNVDCKFVYNGKELEIN